MRFQELYEAILHGDNQAAIEITREALGDGKSPEDLIDGGMIPAMAEAGRLFEEEEYFVPELLLAARAMKAALEMLRPLLTERGAEPRAAS